MPVQHSVDRANRLAIAKCSGEVSRDEVVTSLKELSEHPDFQSTFCQLADLTQVQNVCGVP
jgi:hypothetical protein